MIGLGALTIGIAILAGSPGCTCEPRFYPDALDAACPVHGIPSFLREKFARSEHGIAS